MDVSTIVAGLRSLPALEPDPCWKRRTKRRLLRALRRLYPLRRWAVFVSRDADPAPFAQAVAARGRDWRPVVVDPERSLAAVAAIRPALVVVDSRVGNASALARLIRVRTRMPVVTGQQL
jgi:hypothetical protein